MKIHEKSLDFLDLLASRGENTFTTAKLRTLLTSTLNLGRTEIGAFTKYLMNTGLIKNIYGETYEINNQLRLDMREDPLAFLSKKKVE